MTMSWKINDDGTRMIGFRVPDDPPEVVGTFELEEPSVVVEPNHGPEPIVFEGDPEPLVRTDPTPESCEGAAQLLHNVVCQTATELDVPVNELIRAVRRIEKSRQRTRVRKRRTRIAWASMLADGR